MDPKDKKEEVVIEQKPAEAQPQAEPDILVQKDAEIAKLTEERDNYRAAALARKGKLAADSEFLGEDFDEFVDNKIKTVLADQEIARRNAEKDAELAKIRKENAEMRLALQNRPGGSMGGVGGGSNLEVKDNVFSPQQIEALTAKAKRLGADPVKFIENAKNNIARRN